MCSRRFDAKFERDLVLKDLNFRMSLVLSSLESKKSNSPKNENRNIQKGSVFPVWPDETRALPNGLLRSALFGVVKKGSRCFLDRERIEAIGGVEIIYTGQQLDQGDLDVFLCILHIARHQEIGSKCCFSSRKMLQTLGKTDTGGNREVLHRRVLRLNSSLIELKHGHLTYFGSLICDGYRDEITNEYFISLNPKLAPLFSRDQFTKVDWGVRNTLDGKPLAQWLHCFYSSHAKPYPIKVETLHKLCGSKAELRRYRQTLREALESLSKAGTIHGWAFKFEMDENLVSVKKKATNSQKRHLERKLVSAS